MPGYGYTRPNGNFATDPIAPIPEHYSGDNNPYRGTEDHGVPPTVDDAPIDSPELDYIHMQDFDYPAEKHKQDPVPVYVVNDSPIEEKRIVVTQNPVGDIRPVRIAGQDRNRIRVRILVDGSPIYFNNDANVSVQTGALLVANAGTYQEIITTEEIWAICGTATTAVVYVINERWTDNRTIENKIKK